MSDEQGNATNDGADRLGRQIRCFVLAVLLMLIGIGLERWLG